MPIEGVTHLVGDVMTLDLRDRLKVLVNERKFDCVPPYTKYKQLQVISDMAPKFCGFIYDDHSAFIELNNLTIALSVRMLKIGGNVALKTFNGADEG